MQHETHLIGDGRAARRAVGGQLRLVQLDQVLGLSARAIEAVVHPFRRAVLEIGDDEADVEPERAWLRCARRRAARGPRIWPCAASRHSRARRPCSAMARSVRIGVRRFIDLLRQGLRAGQAEHIIDAIVFAPCHRLGPRVMAVAPKCDARLGPALADMPRQAAQMARTSTPPGVLPGRSTTATGGCVSVS